MTDATQHFEFGATVFPKGNNRKRVYCALVLDRSGSMADAPIAALNEGIRRFADELRRDEAARECVDIAVVSFASDVRVDTPWVQPEAFIPIPMAAEGGTALGAALETALAMIDARTSASKKPFYIPWLILLTDGQPGDTEKAEQMALECQRRVALNKLFVMPVGVGDMDLKWLYKLSPDAKRLDGLNFTGLFKFVSASLAQGQAPTDGVFAS